MRQKGFTIIEVVVVFLLILSVTFLILPGSLNSTKQARLISKWSKKYSELEYIFSVVKAQQEDLFNGQFLKAKDNDDRQKIFLAAIKPYLRVTSEIKSNYKQFYMNGLQVTPESKYYFNKFYLINSNEIIGLKWINGNCSEKKVCAIIVLDVNGVDKPNSWGYDVFGANILKNKIEPIGKGIDTNLLKADCNNKNFGIYCSYYYLIGGRFD